MYIYKAFALIYITLIQYNQPCVTCFTTLQKSSFTHQHFFIFFSERILLRIFHHSAITQVRQKTGFSCMYAWAMNQTNEFCPAKAKFISPFHLFPPYSSSFSSSSLPSFSSSECLMPIKSQNQVKNQAMKSKANVMLDEFIYQWKKRWCCSFLMVWNCNTA